MLRIDINFSQVFRKLCTAILAFSLLLTFFVLPATCAQNSDVQTKRYKPELVVQTGHSGDISSMAFSPDGRMIASGSWDNTVKLWDVETGNEFRTFQAGDLKVLSTAFSPDGKKIAAGCGDFRIRIWDLQSNEIKTTPIGEMRAVNSIVFSQNGKTIVSGSDDGVVRIWNAETLDIIRQLGSIKEMRHDEKRFGWFPDAVETVAYSPSREIIASAGSDDRIITVWDAANGTKLKSMIAPVSIPNSLRFTSDGRHLVSVGDLEILVWDIEKGVVTRTLESHSSNDAGDVDIAIDVSPDGKTVAAVNGRGLLRVWSIDDGSLLKQFSKPGSVFRSIAFSPDGRTIAEGTSGYNISNTILLWNVETAAEIQTFKGNANVITTMALSSDGQKLLESHADSSMTLWSPTNYPGVKKFETADSGAPLVFAPSEPIFAVESLDRTEIWNADTASRIATLPVTLPMTGHPTAFAPDSKQVALAAFDNLSIWDVSQGKLLKTLVPETEIVNIPNVIAIDPTGTLLAGGNLYGALRIWDLRTGKETTSYTIPLDDELVRPCEHTSSIDSLAFSGNGKFLASAGSNGEVKVCDADAKTELWSSKSEEYSVGDQMLVFSPDSRILAGITHDSSIHLWDAATGKLLNSIPGEATSKLRRESIAFSKDGKRLFATSGAIRTKVWDVATGKEIASLITIGENDWAVITPDGYFDASDGAQALLHFVLTDPQTGYETMSLSQINSKRWYPGLLEKVFNGEPLPSVGEFAVTLFPEVQIEQAKPDSPLLKVDLKNRGGGIGRVEVRVNGGEFTPDASAGQPIDRRAAAASLKINIPKDRLRSGDNEIDIITWNLEGDVQSLRYPAFLNLADNGLVSKGGVLTGNKTNKPPSEIDYYAIVSGISNYSGPINLRFSAKDAEDMARALTLAARRYFCADEMAAGKPCLRVHVRLLSTETDEKVRFNGKQYVPDFQRLDPVKNSYETVFADVAAKANADDVVTVYFSGHATTINTEEAVRESAIADTYLYATRDATTLDTSALRNETERAAKTVSSLELAKWLSDIKADKKVLVLDTCAAGAVQKDLSEARDSDPLQTRSIERLRTRTGFFVLMGSAGNAQSFEANQYRQGLLTYSLLEGMTVGGKLAPGGFVDVDLLLSSAKNRVEDLAKGLGNIQVPMYWRPGLSESFDIGRIEDEERKLIPIASPVPIIQRPFLFEKVENSNVINDAEGLTEKLKAALLEQSLVSQRGAGAAINYVDATNGGGITPNGSYTVNGDRIKIVVTLIKNNKPFAEVTASGTRENVIENLVQEMLKTLSAAQIATRGYYESN